MDRKQFLKTVYLKFLKPLIVLSVLIFSIRFIIRIFSQSGMERLIIISVFGFIILVTLFYMLGLIFKSGTDWIKSKMPQKLLANFRIFGNIIKYLMPIALGMVVYDSWRSGGILAVLFFIPTLILYIIEMLREEKTGTTYNRKE